MPEIAVWLQFALLTAVIVFSGSRLSRYGDVIAVKTGWGGAWIGVVLMASVTSLPELITGLSSVILFDLPDIAAGDVLGSCMFNPLILALVDFGRGAPIASRASPSHVITAGFGILMLAVVAASLSTAATLPAVGWVGVSSFVFAGIYLAATRLIFLHERARIAGELEEAVAAAHYDEITLRSAATRYAMHAAVIVGAATWLPHVGSELARITGLGTTFVGTILIALTTSLPEIVVSVESLRIGSVDLLYGNVLGSNLMNILILALDDAAYTKGPLLQHVSASHVVTAMAAIAITAIAAISLIYRARSKFGPVSLDAAAIAGVYAAAVAVLYHNR